MISKRSLKIAKKAKTLGNIDKNAHSAKGSSPSKLGKKKKRPFANKVIIAIINI
jgi:hypothetical protein